MNKKLKRKLKREDRLKNFYLKFKQSRLYYGVMILIILLGLLFFPTGNIIFEVFSKGPFIAGPYIMLTLMFFAFAFYKNIYLYLFVIGLFIISSFISFVGVAMGSTNGDELLLFFLPIVILLVINICIALFTYKYK
ncbi:hypothetical protein [Peptoniphilus phoceensis]|uniref:hypothetical protein n=1 Tax=Peptoniphilus phoceensis TaxID=1720298 RepID=UPI0007867C2D|nr:hypothetical protein [Peptoniphilus phoceensis]